MAEQRERDIIAAFITLTDRLVDDYDVLDLTTQLTQDCRQLLDVTAAGLLLADAGGCFTCWLQHPSSRAPWRHSNCSVTKARVWTPTAPGRR